MSGPVLDELHLIVKIAERCNINCTYCYIFNAGNEEYRSSPPVIEEGTVEALADFIAAAISAHAIPFVSVVLHGGEPLLMKRDRFDRMCGLFRDVAAKGGAELELVMQTNAMLVSDEWISLFEKHGVFIGVSLDGPRSVHDAVRIDHKGRGTFDRVERGVQRLMRAADAGRIARPGVIFVVNTAVEPSDLLRTLVDELGFRNLKFLLPKLPVALRASAAGENRRWVARMSEVFLARNDPQLFLEGVSETLQQLCGTVTAVDAFGPERSGRRVVLSVSSDGRLGLDDSLRSTYADGVLLDLTVHGSTLADYLGDRRVQHHRFHAHHAPDPCLNCCWLNVCFRADDLHLRLGSDGSLDNPSAHCEANKARFQTLSRFLIANGVKRSTITAALTPLVDRPTGPPHHGRRTGAPISLGSAVTGM